MFYSFMLVTQRGHRRLAEYLDFIRQCADGGITSVQLREKSYSYEDLLLFGEALQRVLESYDIPLIINDNPILAKELGTCYVHVGQSDSSVEEVYQYIPEACIGVSIEHEDELYHANTQRLAYVSASAVFASTHKDNVKTLWGLSGIQHMRTISQYPLIGIGGITLQNLPSVLEHGLKGVAVIGALHNTDKAYVIAKAMRACIDSYIE